MPVINGFLLLWAVPGVMAGLVKRKRDSDDVSFVYALMASITMVTAHASCIRFFGAVSCAFAAWRCRDIASTRSKGNLLV
jgi:hypothetical protein